MACVRTSDRRPYQCGGRDSNPQARSGATDPKSAVSPLHHRRLPPAIVPGSRLLRHTYLRGGSPAASPPSAPGVSDCVAVGAEHAETLPPVVRPITIDVVDLQSHRLAQHSAPVPQSTHCSGTPVWTRARRSAVVLVLSSPPFLTSTCSGGRDRVGPGLPRRCALPRTWDVSIPSAASQLRNSARLRVLSARPNRRSASAMETDAATTPCSMSGVGRRALSAARTRSGNVGRRYRRAPRDSTAATSGARTCVSSQQPSAPLQGGWWRRRGSSDSGARSRDHLVNAGA